MPLTLLFLHRFARSGRATDALIAALFFVLTSLASGYYGLLGLLVLPCFAATLLWGRRWSLLAGGISAAGSAGLALLPLYLLHRAALVPEGYARGLAETVLYSASIENFIATNPDNWLYGAALARFTSPANSLFPGLVVPALVLSGAVLLWKRRTTPSRDSLALFALAVGAAMVAVGPEVRLAERTLARGPFHFVREWLPVFEMIRNPSRVGAFAALPLVVLAAKALTAAHARPHFVALLGAMAMAETLIAPISTPKWRHAFDASKPTPPVYAWLAGQPGDFAIVELPMLDARKIYWKPAYHESTYMVRSTVHWKRLVNGYAGLEPGHYRRLRELLRRFPSADSLAALRALEVKYIVVHRKGYGRQRWRRVEQGLEEWSHTLPEVVRFGDDRVLKLAGTTPTVAPSDGRIVNPRRQLLLQP